MAALRTPLRRARAPRAAPARRRVRGALAVAAAGALALTTAGCADDHGGQREAGAQAVPHTVRLPGLAGQHLKVTAVWTGAEQKSFTKVLDEFARRTGARVSFVPSGDDMSAFIGSKVAGGDPPDVAMLPQPGVLHEFARKGWLRPLDPEAAGQLAKNFSKGWQDLGSWEGRRYGVYFKAGNKSLIWYNAKIFDAAGAEVPRTWPEFLRAAQLIADYGVDPVSVAGADGWTLTDWFENIYLSQAGQEKYDGLTRHTVKWTDPSVTQALTTLAQLFGKRELLAGGNAGALRTQFPTSVTKAFAGGADAKAAMVYEGEICVPNITATGAVVGKDAKVFPFPAVGAERPVVTGGDVAVALRPGAAAQALMTFLASPDAAAVWAGQGGFVSANRSLDLSAYRDDTLRSIAKVLVEAGDSFRFDMSDQAPASFGAKPGQGEWKDLQDFLQNPSDVAGAQRRLEEDAQKAYRTYTN
ncbi:ABC transporter substrate-binding protein [Streptomyces gamaensis]|uniref:ABC transporter substrate-binding protein n=1 Tax=Streptomyces gamaensis TaxID=1763542 RepID=A0ABW0Z2L5_9ACTN